MTRKDSDSTPTDNARDEQNKSYLLGRSTY